MDSYQPNVPEDRNSAVAYGTRADAVVPILLLAGDIHPLRASTGSENDGVSGFVRVRFVFFAFTPVFEWARGSVQLRDGLGNDGRPESLGLFAELLHHIGTHDSLREPGKVFHCAKPTRQ